MCADYAEICARGIFTNSGPFEHRFVKALEDWIGGGTSVAVVSSCTSGIELAVRATFLPRYMALAASFTFAAGPLALLACGYQPLFLDIDPISWQPSIVDARQALSERAHEVAGILLTTTFGVADPAIARWEALAAEYGLPLVIDSAAGFGAEYPWRERVGRRGTCEVFSLHATKTLAVGEGGVVSSRDPALVASINLLKNFGFDECRRSVSLGTNAKLPELASAIGIRQLTTLSQRLECRRTTLCTYERYLGPLGIAFQPGAQQSAVAFVSALLPTPVHRDALLASLTASGVECRAYYNPPLHRQPVFASSIAASDLRVTEEIAGRIVSLPMSDEFEPADVRRISEVAARALGS